MDKLTPTRQFGIQFGILFSLGGIGKELECNNIDSYRRKGSLLIQTLYLWDRDRGRGKKPKISHSTFDRKINLIYFVPFAR